jgi:amino acid adenylation domain-containing protein
MALPDRLGHLSPEERSLLFQRLRQRKEEAARSAPEAERRGIPRRDGSGPAPLSFAQQRLWFLDRLTPGAPGYNIPAAVLVDGPLDRAALRQALEAVVARHDSLRTAFELREGSPVQIVAQRAAVPLPMIDLEACGGETSPELARICDEIAHLPFDLSTGPLLRAVLLRLGTERHALILVLHHIVSDGWSTGVLVSDLSALYGGGSLPPLPIQYADFAVWQRGWLQGERLEEQLAVWRRRLEGLPELLALPTDRPRPPVKSSAGACVACSISAEPGTRALALARDEGISLFMLLLATFQAVLHRWSGQQGFAVGTAVANRGRTELETLIGFFVNTLALRADLGGDPTVSELLQRVREVSLEAFAHQDIPFEKLVEELSPGRDPGRSPIFQVSLALQNTPPPRGGFGGLALRAIDVLPRHVKFDLELALESGERGEIRGVLLYSAALFDAATVERMAGHFRTVLLGFIEGRGRRLSELPLLTPGEAAQLASWNQEDVPRNAVPPEEMFASLAAAEPGAPAVVTAAGVLTRGELDAQAWRLAHRLRELGVGPEVPVGVLLPRSADLVLAALAVARSGGAWLPLDPSDPAERIAAVLEDAGAKVVLTRSDLLEVAAGGAEENLHIEAAAADPDTLAYVIYTSGSTGSPKGVGVRRGALSNLIAWSRGALPAGPGDRATLMAGPAFDGSVWELWWFLSAGAAIHIPDDEIRLTPRRLAEWMARERITVSFLPTPLAEALLAEPAAADLPLRALFTGGDRLHRIARRDLPFTVANCYGPSEATVMTTWSPDVVAEPGDRDPSVGRPIGGARVWVLDPWLRLVPVGVPGELWVAGETLARGYLGRPDLTAAAYRPDPFSITPGARMYRTGDLSRRRPDGSLEVLGRLDGQMKLRGHRIETGEVEAALLRYPGVRQAVVMARDNNGIRQLVAFLVIQEEADLQEVELRDHLRRSLTGPMIPSSFVVLPELPLISGGKVDRAALSRMVPVIASAPEVKKILPRSMTESRLATIWSQVLGREPIGVDESFFDLGGHSLLLTAVQARIGEELGREVPLMSLIEHPTVATFAAWLDGVGETATPSGQGIGESQDRVSRQRRALELQRQRLERRPPTR